MTPTRIRTWPTLLIAVIAPALAHPAQAVPPVGTVITETNVSTVTDLISPVVEWSVKHGMQLTIGPYKKIEMPKAYVTEKYAGQVGWSTALTCRG